MKKLRDNKKVVSFLGAGVVLFALLGGGLQVLPAFTADERAELQAIRDDAADIIVRADRLLAVTTTTQPPTTTAPTTTTTTRPPTTTTTAPPTTTTQPPTTTTTGPLPTPTGERFIVNLINADNSDRWWDADYFRTLPFTANTGWTDGERAGYKCLYAFLLQNDVPVGRVIFTRVPGANYAKVNDTYMKEGARHFDGSLPPPAVSQAECPSPVQEYTEYTGPDQRPVVTYTRTNGNLLEIRDYTKTVAHPDIKFRLLSVEGEVFDANGNRIAFSRVTVVAYLNNLPALVIYYDSLIPGVVMDADL